MSDLPNDEVINKCFVGKIIKHFGYGKGEVELETEDGFIADIANLNGFAAITNVERVSDRKHRMAIVELGRAAREFGYVLLTDQEYKDLKSNQAPRGALDMD